MGKLPHVTIGSLWACSPKPYGYARSLTRGFANSSEEEHPLPLPDPLPCSRP